MTSFVFHHYPESPFSEKVRAIFGYKKLSWTSVQIPTIMPKPDLVALTGGYRKTPVLQIGADIYCDSQLITRVLEEACPEKTIYPDAYSGAAFLLSQWIDSSLFNTCVALVFSPAGIAKFLSSRSQEDAQAFAADRAKLTEGSKSNLGRMPPEIAEINLARYLEGLDRQLQTAGPWILGPVPTTADFSLYHCLWFLRENPGLAPLIDPYVGVLDWYARIRAFGHGEATPAESEAAVEIASAASPTKILAPTTQASDKFALGQDIAVVPLDYGLVPVVGELIQASSDRISIRRTDERAGVVHVHFPRVGFEIIDSPNA
jgi:glutathione S-transferase